MKRAMAILMCRTLLWERRPNPVAAMEMPEPFTLGEMTNAGTRRFSTILRSVA